METISDSGWPRDSGGQGDAGARGREGGHVPPQSLTPALEEVARAFRSKPFVPHTLIRNGHAQTIAATLRVQRLAELRGADALYESRTVEVEPGARVLLKCRWQGGGGGARRGAALPPHT